MLFPRLPTPRLARYAPHLPCFRFRGRSYGRGSENNQDRGPSGSDKKISRNVHFFVLKSCLYSAPLKYSPQKRKQGKRGPYGIKKKVVVMKQHKDIREILKRSGTAPTGICGFWRSAVSFAGCAFRRVCGVQISRGYLSRRGRFLGLLPLVMALAAVSGHRASRPFPRGCPRAVSSAAVLLTFNTLQLWEKSHCYSQGDLYT